MPRTSNANKHNTTPKDSFPKKVPQEPLKPWLRSGKSRALKADNKPLLPPPESPPFRGFIPTPIQGPSTTPINLAQYISASVNESMKEETMDAHDLTTVAGIKKNWEAQCANIISVMLSLDKGLKCST